MIVYLCFLLKRVSTCSQARVMVKMIFSKKKQNMNVMIVKIKVFIYIPFSTVYLVIINYIYLNISNFRSVTPSYPIFHCISCYYYLYLLKYFKLQVCHSFQCLVTSCPVYHFTVLAVVSQMFWIKAAFNSEKCADSLKCFITNLISIPSSCVC